ATVLQRFDRILLETSFEFFQNDVIDYIATYGSWDPAARAEPFGQFEQRRNGDLGGSEAVGADGRPLPPPRFVTPRRRARGGPAPGGPPLPSGGPPVPGRGGFGQENLPPFR